MTSPLISIIIPTFNRKEILKLTLGALSRQILKDFEVIVVDDESNDGTEEMVKQFLEKPDIKIKYFRKNHQGQGIARNFGAERARGDLILFLGDDMVPQPNFLEEHLKTHRDNKDIAVLGYAEWHPDLKITDFMRWLAPCGFGFNYCNISNPNDIGFEHFYTSNISLEKKWLEEEKFDPIFTGYGFEDAELGYRLTKKGLRVVYNPKAVVYHYHQITLEEYCKKAREIAQCLILLSKKHPELSKRWIKPVRPVLFAVSILRKIPFLKSLNKNLYFLVEVTYHKYNELAKILKLKT